MAVTLDSLPDCRKLVRTFLGLDFVLDGSKSELPCLRSAEHPSQGVRHRALRRPTGEGSLQTSRKLPFEW